PAGLLPDLPAAGGPRPARARRAPRTQRDRRHRLRGHRTHRCRRHRPREGGRPMTRPETFTQDSLGWIPWLQPVEREDLTPEQHEALQDDFRRAMPYFRLLARDPQALAART